MVDDLQAFGIWCIIWILTIPIAAIVMILSPTGPTALTVVIVVCSFILVTAIIFMKRVEIY